MGSFKKKIVKCEKCGYRFYTRNKKNPIACPECRNLVSVENEPNVEITTEKDEKEENSDEEIEFEKEEEIKFDDD